MDYRNEENKEVFTEKDLINFGKYVLSHGRMADIIFNSLMNGLNEEDAVERIHDVYHSDIENWYAYQKEKDEQEHLKDIGEPLFTSREDTIEEIMDSLGYTEKAKQFEKKIKGIKEAHNGKLPRYKEEPLQDYKAKIVIIRLD